jgi:phenylpropionate dioxygenase-like ring-hydroxylating dioxygenase large terminal subunit
MMNDRYTSEGIFNLEKRKVFPNNWHCVGRHELPNIGDYITGQVVSTPYVVVRGSDNKLRAFFNVCTHHANILVQDDAGNAKVLQSIHTSFSSLYA